MSNSQKLLPDPSISASKCGFILDLPIDRTKRRHTGTCICGTRGSISYDSFVKKTFCRNEKCNYYQQAKQLDHDERKIIVEEKKCKLISLNGNGVNTIIEYICHCGFKQKTKWLLYYRENHCQNFECLNYHKSKELTTELIKAWFEFRDYKVPDNFKYINSSYHYYKYDLICPNNHKFTTTVQMWVDGARCKVCNGNGRTLSLQELQEFYGKYNCILLYTADDYLGDVSKKIVPYMCENGHIIDNLTKNTFNNRINLNLGPCAICREVKRDRNEEQKKREITMYERYGYNHVTQVPSFFSKVLESSFRLKKYTLPSGSIIKIQGYEPRCMDMLLENYDEKDILTDLEDMPDIMYFNKEKNKNSRYYPDIYIPKDNLLIEVKSTYTLEKELEKNEAKFKACVDLGYTLFLYVFDNKNLLYRRYYSKNNNYVEPYPPANIVLMDENNELKEQ